MENCNSVSTPSEISAREPKEGSTCDEGSYPYQELIESLMYLPTCTRPDIANTVSKLAQFNNSPSKENWMSAKRVLRYLADTSDLGLSYKRTNKGIVGYLDADWGGCTVDRRSYTGYVYLLGGGAISWKSQKQRTVALSSTEAEYTSMAEAVKEGIYLQSLLGKLNLFKMTKVTLYVDNRRAQFLANNHLYHSQTKHIDIRYHFIREVISSDRLKLEHVATSQMAADYLTKALPKDGHWKCAKKCGLVWI